MADMTPADVMAINGSRDNFLEGNGIVILILFFLMFGGGFGGFGGNAATQGALTRAEMQDGFNTAEIQRNQADIVAAITANGREVLENRYATQLGFQNMQAQQAQCCCDLRTAIHSEGEQTRALIQANTIQELRDNLQAAQLTLGNAAQTQNLLAAMGRWVQNPSVNPYTCYNGCGCV